MDIIGLVAFLFIICSVPWMAIMLPRANRATLQASDDSYRLRLPINPAASLFHVAALLILVGSAFVTFSAESPLWLFVGAGGALGNLAAGVLVQYVFDIRNIVLHRELTR